MKTVSIIFLAELILEKLNPDLGGVPQLPDSDTKNIARKPKRVRYWSRSKLLFQRLRSKLPSDENNSPDHGGHRDN